MSCKVFFLSAALLFALISRSTTAKVQPPKLRLNLHFTQKIAKQSGTPLIDTACRGVGAHEKECFDTLRSAPPHQQADAGELAFFALKYVEDHAVNVTTIIKTIVGNFSDLAPMLQASLSECLDQYNPLDDLIEDAINELLAKSYEETKKFLMAAMTNIEVCDSQLKGSTAEEKAEKKSQLEIEWSQDLSNYNDYLKNLLAAAMNILQSD
ncbi:hypothetical protein Salat_2224100 [Sesamum alatum]|uniref:Pectinesterase inhibitor domain-containing protein n=1 Tax=Sesamum alatum TaxID=300844 RepID=A0AAE2CDG8_9LAMI|nr:hypothetical protein Salat_2224100 [Sesamum alatum]